MQHFCDGKTRRRFTEWNFGGICNGRCFKFSPAFEITLEPRANAFINSIHDIWPTWRMLYFYFPAFHFPVEPPANCVSLSGVRWNLGKKKQKCNQCFHVERWNYLYLTGFLTIFQHKNRQKGEIKAAFVWQNDVNFGQATSSLDMALCWGGKYQLTCEGGVGQHKKYERMQVTHDKGSGYYRRPLVTMHLQPKKAQGGNKSGSSLES